MKTTVDNLDPSRIKLTVEVPYEELQPSLEAAYKEIGSQVQVPGFRPGHVPNRIIDQRVGRAAVIQEAVNNALPDLYQDALKTSERVPMVQPEVEVAELPNVSGANGGQLVFTAEVTVRPEITIPDLDSLELTVDAVEVSEEDVTEELDSLRARFGSLKSVSRKAKTGDFVTIDLTAVIDGEEVDSVSGVSYEIGKGNMLKGLDTALRGLKTGESTTFTTTLAGGEHEGEEADVTVTASAVKQRDLPAADDDFAQEASEFDTIEELREDLSKQVAQRRTSEQAVAARDALLEALREAIDFEVPQAVVDQEISRHLQAEGKEADDDHAKEIRDDVVSSVRDQIILDVLVEQVEVGVSQDELWEFLFQTAQQYGMEPAQFIQGAQQAGQMPNFVAEIARNKSLAVALRRVSVTDSAGQAVDLTEFIGSDEADSGGTGSETSDETDDAAGDSAGEDEAAQADDIVRTGGLVSQPDAPAEGEDVVEAEGSQDRD
ncbi:trigger factor [Actinomyces lilanjuaniae]|uniref:Trigger factor n=1 Tax=Actinomyces lilanjuaniae TaxID=2321394 RepID=A0ABM6Z2G9_9ACTO|nr:trigger factor [Actinomyces lilanjuaniae]AYD89498.1 trigger factor [Actinomyces lilanjuaniae]